MILKICGVFIQGRSCQVRRQESPASFTAVPSPAGTVQEPKEFKIQQEAVEAQGIPGQKVILPTSSFIAGRVSMCMEA